MQERVVPGFLPSRYGAAYPNRWPDVPALEWRLGPARLGLGNASEGLCGGMCLVARDRWGRSEPAPTDALPPDPGSPGFREVVGRQVASLGTLGWVPFVFFLLAAILRDEPLPLPVGGSLPSRREVTLRRSWPALRRRLDADRPVVLGLIREAGLNPLRLTRNHQVLAWGYTIAGGTVRVAIYDPNHPGRDDVTIELAIGPGEGPAADRVRLSQSTGEPLLAFFVAD
jgi:hypothetical protein